MTATLTASTALDATPLSQDAKVIALVGTAHASSHFAHMLLSPLFLLFIKDFGLSFTELGLLTTVFFVISGIGQAGAGVGRQKAAH